MKQDQFEVIVVGGGHAGCEAAHVAARMGARVALVTLDKSKIGVMSCNPAIGGLGKGHLVREIDALGGVMGRVADKAGIQFRLLNRRKGPAVRGPRAQCDRVIYRDSMHKELTSLQLISIIGGEVEDLVVSQGAVTGVLLSGGRTLRARSVIITTGTFLGGVIHIGDESFPAGRMGEMPSNRLAGRFRDIGFPLGRLKTGTPPRLDGKTINWAVLEDQPGDEDPTFFSFDTKSVSVKQVKCGITYTNARTHAIIRDNLQKSAMYGGKIDGIGPRYCPSIEDKVVRFADKESHQIFLEPESLTRDTVYPNGISTSLPADVQLDYVRSIQGLEDAEIEQLGYAIEYDYVDPRALNSVLQTRQVPGLFLAGQINGTTGYEEAAAQGIVAGINAVNHSRGEARIPFSRTDSYIGVMIDDLTSRGVTEPYRMFTSRAEFRLSLRIDNADQRLTPKAISIGCVDPLRERVFHVKIDELRRMKAMLISDTWLPTAISSAGIAISADGGRRSSWDLLSFPKVAFEQLVKLNPAYAKIPKEIQLQLSCDAVYSKYLERQTRDVATLKREESMEIPEFLDYAAIVGLSTELKIKLAQQRPESIARAARIDGITPAALALILSHIRPKLKHG